MSETTTQEFERALAERDAQRYVLRLYVTGATPGSGRAIANLKTLCEKHLKGRYDLEVIDVYRQPKLAEGDQIVATPTLVRREPLPLRRLVGDLSDARTVLRGLDLRYEV